MEQLGFVPANVLAREIREGRLSAVEVVEVYLDRIARHNPSIAAVASLTAEQARERARAADTALARGELWGPLHGVPMTLEDCHATAGIRSTWGGFPPLADHIPVEDGTVARRLLAADAILLGKSNGPTIWADSLFPRTNNPWDLARSPGGSSAGPGAAVAAGLSAFDIGLDTLGSIQRPAHQCGVYGMRPTEHRVPLTGVFFIDPVRKFRVMSVAGPMARSVEDLSLLLGLLAGPDGRDTHIPPVPWRPADIPLAAARVAWTPTLPGMLIEDEISAAIEGLARQDSDLGGVVAEALPDIDFADQLHLGEELFTRVASALSDPDSPPQEQTLDAYFLALERRDGFIQAWDAFFAGWDVLLCPVYGNTAQLHGASELTCNGSPVAQADTFRLALPRAIGPVSGCPVVVMPLGRDRGGMPFGLLLVGPRWGDEKLLALAAQLSALTGGFQAPPFE